MTLQFIGSASGTSPAATIPAHQAGDRILLLHASYFDSSMTVGALGGDAWTTIFGYRANDYLVVSAWEILARSTALAQTTVAITGHDGVGATAAFVFRGASLTPATTAGANSTTNPPSLASPEAGSSVAWVACLFIRGLTAPTSGPEGYEGFVSAAGGGSMSGAIGAAYAINNADAEDPGPFTGGASYFHARTIAILGPPPPPLPAQAWG